MRSKIKSGRVAAEAASNGDEVASATGVDGVQDRIKELIFSGALEPGLRVNELSLTHQLGVGRPWIRQALRTLEHAGLVRIVPNRGAEIRQVSLEDVLDLFEVRAGLASTVGRVAAQRATKQDIDQLWALHEEMVDLIETGDSVKYRRLNLAFHQKLIASTRNERLISMNAAIDDEIRLYPSKGHEIALGSLQRSVQEHLSILNAIKAGDPATASKAFETHVLGGKQRLADGLAGMPL